jgi:hypothetical protein
MAGIGIDLNVSQARFNLRRYTNYVQLCCRRVNRKQGTNSGENEAALTTDCTAQSECDSPDYKEARQTVKKMGALAIKKVAKRSHKAVQEV